MELTSYYRQTGLDTTRNGNYLGPETIIETPEQMAGFREWMKRRARNMRNRRRRRRKTVRRNTSAISYPVKRGFPVYRSDPALSGFDFGSLMSTIGEGINKVSNILPKQPLSITTPKNVYTIGPEGFAFNNLPSFSPVTDTSAVAAVAPEQSKTDYMKFLPLAVPIALAFLKGK